MRKASYAFALIAGMALLFIASGARAEPTDGPINLWIHVDRTELNARQFTEEPKIACRVFGNHGDPSKPVKILIDISFKHADILCAAFFSTVGEEVNLHWKPHPGSVSVQDGLIQQIKFSRDTILNRFHPQSWDLVQTKESAGGTPYTPLEIDLADNSTYVSPQAQVIAFSYSSGCDAIFRTEDAAAFEGILIPWVTGCHPSYESVCAKPPEGIYHPLYLADCMELISLYRSDRWVTIDGRLVPKAWGIPPDRVEYRRLHIHRIIAGSVPPIAAPAQRFESVQEMQQPSFLERLKSLLIHKPGE